MEGGIGAGTVMRFDMTIMGRTQSAQHRVEEPEPGRGLREIDRIDTVWNAGGLTGPVMKLLAPRALGPIYREELQNLDRYARDQGDG